MMFYSDTATVRTDLVERERVCAIEIWCEALGGRQDTYKRSNGLEITDIMSKIQGWHPVKSPRRHGIYGNQRGFEKDGA